MRFNINKVKKKPNPLIGKKGPNVGDEKTIIKFAWFPKRIEKTKIVWLEKYVEVMVYKKTFKIENNWDYNSNERMERGKHEYNDWCLKERKFII